jgi:aspartate aminotransferase-like enzyme
VGNPHYFSFPLVLSAGKSDTHIITNKLKQLAGGQDQWKGKIVRIAHLGYIDSFDIIIAISALEMALKKMGHDVVLGRGVAAAQEILLEGY